MLLVLLSLSVLIILIDICKRIDSGCFWLGRWPNGVLYHNDGIAWRREGGAKWQENEEGCGFVVVERSVMG
jgi:hypothetical protein